MSVSVATRQAYSEIDEFLSLLSEEQRNEIPSKLRELFRDEKDKEYIKHINADLSIKDQNLKEETLAIIALLNLQYWCKDENEKRRLQEVYAKNERVYQDKLYKKYNPNDIFKKSNESVIDNTINKKDELQIVEYHQTLFRKIINRIVSIFNLKNF